MKPKYQEQVPDGCWIACISMLTKIPQEQMISFIPKTERNAEWEKYYHKVKRFLKKNGWLLFSTKEHIPKGWSILTGKRTDGEVHAVVAFNGETKFDPDPANVPIKKEKEYEILIEVI